MLNNNPPPKIKSMIDGLLKQARKQLAGEGEVTPAAIIIGDEHAVVDMRVTHEHEKDQVAFMIRELVKLHNAESVALISEVWGLPFEMPNKRQAELIAKYKYPSECPERVEQVFIKLETRDGQQWTCISQIVRSGRTVKLGKTWMLDGSKEEYSGRYAGFYAPEKAMPKRDDLLAMVGNMPDDSPNPFLDPETLYTP